AGLDVLVQRAVLENIKRLRGRGKTILFSTHIMREVEKLCDRVAVMAKGRVVVCGTLDELRQMYKQDDLEELFFSLVSGGAHSCRPPVSRHPSGCAKRRAPRGVAANKWATSLLAKICALSLLPLHQLLERAANHRRGVRTDAVHLAVLRLLQPV